MLHGLERARAHTAARAIGVARGGLEDAIAYVHERVQFGQPIGEFQAIRFKIAKMAAEIEAARQLLYSVCEKIDGNERCDLDSSMAKYVASEMAERVTSEALQIHGGAGLHQASRGRALLARCAIDQDLRRDFGDPAAHHLRPSSRQAHNHDQRGARRRTHLFRGLRAGRGHAPCARQDRRGGRARDDHQPGDEHGAGAFQRARDEEQRLRPGGSSSAATRRRSSSALRRRTRRSMRWPSSASTRFASQRRSSPATPSAPTRKCLRSPDAERADAGVVHFRHWGVNQDDKIVFEGERKVLVQRREPRR